MSPKRDRQQVSIATSDYKRLVKLRDELEKVSGRKVSVTETIARAILCLEDAHADGAWLNPREQAVVMQGRVDGQLKSVIAQVLARLAPEVRIEAIQIDHSTERLTIHIEDEDPVNIIGVGAAAQHARVAN